MIVFAKQLSKIVIVFCVVVFILTGNEPYCSLLGMLPVSYDLNHFIPFWNKILYHISPCWSGSLYRDPNSSTLKILP
jgi:hypothetical protein